MTSTMPNANRFIADKNALKARVEAQNYAIGLVRDPDATADQPRDLILAEGVLPEDNFFSCGIISARVIDPT